MKNIHVLLRSYNSYKVFELIKKLSKTGIFSSITVIINEKEDNIDTKNILKNLSNKIPLYSISLYDYGWSKALNAGIKYLINNHILKDQAENTFIMPISNEVKIDKERILLLLETASKDNVSCAYTLFYDRLETTYLLPRNTCLLWKLNVFHEIGYFNENNDLNMGMEDYEMALRCFQKQNLLPAVIPIKCTLKIRDKAIFNNKLNNECFAVKLIEENFPKEIVDHLKKHINNENKKVFKSSKYKVL